MWRRPPAMVAALNREHAGCGGGFVGPYTLLDPLSRIGVQHSLFSRGWYADGEMGIGKMSVPRRTSTLLPLRPGNLILVAPALEWEIAATRIHDIVPVSSWF